jgi:hypothetical protein
MAEMPTWTLTYHARPMSLNVERAGNRFQRAPLVKEWRDAYRWLAAEDRIPPLQWIHVEARPQYRTARSLPVTLTRPARHASRRSITTSVQQVGALCQDSM